MLFASASLARRVERAEATLIADFGRAAARRLGRDRVSINEVAGGIAVAGGPGAPFSKVAGLGFEPLEPSALDAIERAFDELATPVRVELCSLADPAAGALLTRRGYLLQGFENALAKVPSADPPTVAGVSVTRVEGGDGGPWRNMLVTAFAHADTYDGPAVDEPIDQAALEAVFDQIAEVGGFGRYVAYRNGEPAGAAGLRVVDGVAQLCGAGTLPAHRRHGVQTALLQHRLAEAARAGCTLAVVTTQPGSVSQQNVQRQGFELLYTRAVLIRQSPIVNP